MRIRIRRAYEDPKPEDGVRILVDRLWPRGISKERARIDLWLREAAPSNTLRKWFHQHRERWDEFRQRYIMELEKNRQALEPLKEFTPKSRITFVFSAKDERCNNAAILKEYLEERWKQ